MEKHVCGNCDWKGKNPNEIEHLAQRLDPGSVVPSGECPECMALCYLEKPNDLNKYGEVCWCGGDVQTLRPDLSDIEAEEFLSRNEKQLRDRLIELGWEVMGTLLAMDEHLPETSHKN